MTLYMIKLHLPSTKRPTEVETLRTEEATTRTVKTAGSLAQAILINMAPRIALKESISIIRNG